MTQEPIQTQQSFPSKYPYKEDLFSFMDAILILTRQLKLIIIIPSIFCTVTIFYALFFASPLYVSTATFMSSESEGNNSQMMGLASQFGFALPHNDTGPKWSYIDIIKSRTLARGLLEYKFDTEEYGPQKKLFQILTDGDESPVVGTAISIVQKMIEITTSGTMYRLKITTFDPQLTSDIAYAVMTELDRHQREYNDRKTIETREFIAERLIETEIELEASEEALKVFRERNRSILESPQLQLEQERLSRDVAVLIGVFTTLKQQLETVKIDEVKESDYIVILDEPETPLNPFKPNKKTMVILSGFIGMGLGIILAFVREYIKNIDEAEHDKIGKAKSYIVKNILEMLPPIFKK